MITGQAYLERGKPVTVLIQRNGSRQPGRGEPLEHVTTKTAPRNVAIRRQDGTVTVRPFRGLRKPEKQSAPTGAVKEDEGS